MEVEVPAEPALEIKKEQRFEGEAAYTTAKLSGKLGQKVEYRISVKDTGNTSLSLKPLSDPKCDAGTLVGPSQSPIAPGETATYSCSHVLSSTGVYTNVATVSATPPEEPPISHETPPVEVEVPAEPGFETKKEQRIEGEPAYTTAKLQAKLGQKVEYRISVKDTGNTSLALASLSDAKCDAGTISGPSQSPIAPGESATYSCSHVLSSLGAYTNVATVSATPPGEPPISHETPPVEVEVPAEPAFTIQKLQTIANSGSSFTTATLTGTVGQTVDYEIVVKNTGNAPLSISGFSDPHCDAGTLAGGPTKALAASEAATYTCSHVLTSADQSAGSYSNIATDTATPPEGKGAPITLTSNTVVVNVPASPPSTVPTPPSPPAPKAAVLPAATVTPALNGPQGCVRGGFVVSVKAAGVSSVTFYLDGRKLRTLSIKNVRHGKFSISINAVKLSVGAHRIQAKIKMASGGASTRGFSLRGLTFVRCASSAIAPKFTG